MVKFCDKECEERGSICDFCIYYLDEYRDILKLKDEHGRLEFAGDGICKIDKHEVDACSGYNCDNFHCFVIKNLEEI